MKRLLLTFVVLMITAISTLAAETVTIGNITYSYEGTTATLTDGRNASGAISIPSKITVNGVYYTVTEIGKEAFLRNDKITSVTIPNTVTTIKSAAFFNCINITSITIPSTVTTMENAIFQNCYGLTEAFVYSSAINSCEATFSFCKSLRTVYLSNNVTRIGNATFNSCSSLNSFINNNVTYIGKNAFRNCTSMLTVKATKVSTVEVQAFAGCTNLRSIDFSSCPLRGAVVERTASMTPFQLIPNSTLICLPEGNKHADGEVNVVIGTTCDKYVLTEGTPFNVPITKFTAKEIVYERSIPANSVSTFFLDYVPPTRDGVKYYKLDNVSGSTLTFKEVIELKANNPYLITTGNTAVSDFSVNTDTEVYWVNETGAQYYGIGRARFIGNSEEKGFEELTSNAAQSSYVFSQNDMTWNRVTSSNKTVSVPPFRAYISKETDGAPNQYSTILEDDEATGIQQIHTIDIDGTENYYDLNGRRLDQPQRGINIVNGKKILVK